jgi:regulatory protein
VTVAGVPDGQPDGEVANDAATSLEAAAIRLLASREHSRAELARKLATRFGRSALVEDVLDGLQSRELLSERRFVEHYIAQRHRKGFGPLRIRAELSERGVSDEQVESGFDVAAIDWEDALSAAAEQKFGAAPAADRRSLARRGRFLEQRGFPISLIRRYLDRSAPR